MIIALDELRLATARMGPSEAIRMGASAGYRAAGLVDGPLLASMKPPTFGAAIYLTAMTSQIRKLVHRQPHRVPR
jgi:hypothetical protein